MPHVLQLARRGHDLYTHAYGMPRHDHARHAATGSRAPRCIAMAAISGQVCLASASVPKSQTHQQERIRAVLKARAVFTRERCHLRRGVSTARLRQVCDKTVPGEHS